ncbi:MAG: CRISPR-associated protein Cas4 [Candidatus Cloacimonetes bacterium]|nr:CRISPR-associated protein Cas4 [Candidatus Cloacimonadota bacterium]
MLNELIITGTQINYYFVCKRELWLFSHQINMEHTSELVELGKLIHEGSYQREKKEIQIGPIKIDFIGNDGVVHEVKKTPAVEEAHIWQLKYYLYYLQCQRIENVHGMINYPKLKQTVRIDLENGDIERIEEIINAIKEIIQREEVPGVKNARICQKCSYYDLCYI